MFPEPKVILEMSHLGLVTTKSLNLYILIIMYLTDFICCKTCTLILKVAVAIVTLFDEGQMYIEF